MNGSHFLESLKEVGYTKTRGLKAQSFDWMFESDNALPFLEWFCNNLGSENVLSRNELLEFEELQKENKVLDSQQLDDALKNCAENTDGDPLPSEEELRVQIEELEKEIQDSKKWKEQIIKQKNQLSIHATALSHRHSQIGVLDTKASQKLTKHKQNNQTDNNKYNACLESLTSSVDELKEFYCGSKDAEWTSQSDDSFLSQVDLDEFYLAESKFTSQLNRFTKKQFFEGIAELAGQGDTGRYSILEISDPYSLLIKGENEQVNEADCKELARLQAIYPIGEYQRLTAAVEEQCLSKLCRFVEDKSQSRRSHIYPTDEGELSELLHAKEKSVANLKRQSSMFGEDRVLRLLRESASSQGNRILRGDYELKIARQNYFISNQDRVLDQLTLQRSRYELLTMAYEVEAQYHRDMHCLLSAVSSEMKKMISDHNGRVEMMEQNPGHAKNRLKRGTVDPRDSFILALNKILDSSADKKDDRQMFLTFASVENTAERINSEATASRLGVSTMLAAKDERITSLESQLKKNETVLYSRSSTSKGLPQLVPPKLVEVMTTLEAVLHRLETAIRNTIGDVDQKKKILKTDRLQAMGRTLFVKFIKDPTLLRQTVAEIEARR